MKLNVVYNKKIPDYDKVLECLKKELELSNLNYASFDIDEMQKDGSLTIALGGDGTILKTAKFYSDYEIPVLGINMGRLGFLSQTETISEIVRSIKNGEYYTETRLMLTTDNYVALNDVVIKGCTPSRSSNFSLEINENEVCNYIADGLIISTPTGSTAYCLSAGGPVLYPTLDSVVIVPICPHTLNARPLVIPSGENLVVKTKDKLLSVAIDGYDTIDCVNKVEINVSKKKALFAFLKERQFYSVLRNKLHWGVAPESRL